MDENTEFWAMVADFDFEHHIVREVKRGHVAWHVVCSCGEIFAARHTEALDDQALHAATIFSAGLTPAN